MSAAECICFVLYASLIFGDLVPVENKHWQIYTHLRQIVVIILCRHITKQDNNLLKTLIMEHHNLIKTYLMNH